MLQLGCCQAPCLIIAAKSLIGRAGLRHTSDEGDRRQSGPSCRRRWQHSGFCAYLPGWPFGHRRIAYAALAPG